MRKAVLLVLTLCLAAPLGSNKAADTENDPDAPRSGSPSDAVRKDHALDRRIQRHKLFRKRNVLGLLLPA